MRKKEKQKQKQKSISRKSSEPKSNLEIIIPAWNSARKLREKKKKEKKREKGVR